MESTTWAALRALAEAAKQEEAARQAQLPSLVALANLLAPTPSRTLTSLGTKAEIGLGTTRNPLNFEAIGRMLAAPSPQYREPMSADQYLRNILAREKVDTSQSSPVLGVQRTVRPIIEGWAGKHLVGMSPSGSFAKGTPNKSGTDIDLFVSLSSSVTTTLKEIYNSLFTRLQSNGYTPSKQNVSINISVNGYSVDIVPAKRQDTHSNDHSLYRLKADTWTKTNVNKHINLIANSGRLEEIRIIKLWRGQKAIDFPSFYLELTVLAALSGKQTGNISSNVWSVFEYLENNFASARVVDPANTNNIISDDLTASEKALIKAAARIARAAKYWSEIVK